MNFEAQSCWQKRDSHSTGIYSLLLKCWVIYTWVNFVTNCCTIWFDLWLGIIELAFTIKDCWTYPWFCLFNYQAWVSRFRFTRTIATFATSLARTTSSPSTSTSWRPRKKRRPSTSGWSRRRPSNPAAAKAPEKKNQGSVTSLLSKTGNLESLFSYFECFTTKLSPTWHRWMLDYKWLTAKCAHGKHLKICFLASRWLNSLQFIVWF